MTTTTEWVCGSSREASVFGEKPSGGPQLEGEPVIRARCCQSWSAPLARGQGPQTRVWEEWQNRHQRFQPHPAQGQQRRADPTHVWPIPRWAWASKPPRRQRLITKPFPLLPPAFRNTDVTDKSRHHLGSIRQQLHCFSLSQWDNLKATHPTWLLWNVFRVLATDQRKCQALIILMVTHLFSW